ncbi:hypothetical protein JHK86_030000 [Glycine max]|nr:hypothetical protein JHK86_030000 [Glycine max]
MPHRIILILNLRRHVFLGPIHIGRHVGSPDVALLALDSTARRGVEPNHYYVRTCGGKRRGFRQRGGCLVIVVSTSMCVWGTPHHNPQCIGFVSLSFYKDEGAMYEEQCHVVDNSTIVGLYVAFPPNYVGFVFYLTPGTEALLMGVLIEFKHCANLYLQHRASSTD